jgi:RHS repeat-associated protein
MSASGSTVNPYRFGAAWGYITDTPGSGLLQLGARFYWPEVGRFVQQDPVGDGMNWYAYAGNNPLVWVDPTGLEETASFWLNLIQPESWQQLQMSAAATASGVITGASLGMLRPDWRNPCDQWGSLSRNLGIASGAALAAAGAWSAYAPGDLLNIGKPFWRYWNPMSRGGPLGPWLTRGPVAPYLRAGEAQARLALEYAPNLYNEVKVPWWRPVIGGWKAGAKFGQPGGGYEWLMPLFGGM